MQREQLMAARQPVFSSKQIAAALGVSVSSVKRWCDRDSIPTVRTVGGHRRVPLDGLLHFLRGSDYQLVDPAAIGLSSPLVDPQAAPAWDRGTERGRFQHALLEGDEVAARALFWRYLQRSPNQSLAAEQFITAAMAQFGHAWEDGQVQVYQERRACEINRRLLNELRQRILSRRDLTQAPIAIGGSPAGDPYQLPSALVEVALLEAGWNAMNLGNDLPLDSLLQAAIDYQPRLFWLSTSAVADEPRFVEDFNRLADALSPEVALLVGGRGLSESLRPRLRYTAYCDNLGQMIGLATALKNSQSEIPPTGQQDTGGGLSTEPTG